MTSIPQLLVAFVFIGLQASAFAWRSTLYPENWTPPTTSSFSNDKLIQDFSYAGYRRGEHPIPVVAGPIFDVTDYGADPTGVVDSTLAIQTAIDAAATAGGGVAKLPAGTFRVSLPAGANEILRIKNNNVVLRGAGSSQTFLLNSSYVMRSKAIIRVAPNSVSTSASVLLTADLDKPTRRIPVANPAAFNVGDFVQMHWEFSAGWIADHQQGTWWNVNRRPADANYRREITAVNIADGWVEIDVPTRYTMLQRDNARMSRITGMIFGSGVEGISIGNVQHPGTTWGESDIDTVGKPAYDVHSSSVLTVHRVRDCWLSDISTFQPTGNTSTCHILSNGVVLTESFRVTVMNCAMRRAQYGGGGGNGYMFRVQNSNECLLANCIADFSRHGFVTSHAGTTGNVFHRCEDRETARATGAGSPYMSTSGVSSDNHMHFSHSNLWDQCHAYNSTFQAKHRHGMGTVPHALTAAQSVYWNTSGSGTRFNNIVESEQGRYGYIIGISGTHKSGVVVSPTQYNTAPLDHLEGNGQGASLEPQSLFLDQQNRRLALPTLSLLLTSPIRLPENTFSLEATFTDEGIQITNVDSVTWSVTSTPTSAVVTPTGTTTLNPSFQVDKAGIYTIHALVEHAGKSASAHIQVEVLPEYQPEILLSVTDPARLPDNVFGLTATLRLGGQPVFDFDSITWSITSSPTGAVSSITNGETLTPSFTVDKAGTYVVSATLQRAGKTANKQISVDVLPEYQPELFLSITDAARLPDNQFSLAAAIMYAGASVEDFNSIAWSVVSSPPGSNISITGGATLAPTFTVNLDGSYVIRASLERDGKNATQEITIEVIPEGGLDHVFANMINQSFTVPNDDNLIVGSGSSNYLHISYGGSSSVAHTLDASLANIVAINVGNIRVGGRSDPTSSASSAIDGQLKLGKNNTITATTLIEVGVGGHINTGILTTASDSTTTINSPIVSIGAAMRTGGTSPSPNFTTGTGSVLTLQGTSGGRTALIVGEERNASSSINWSSSGNMNLAGGQATLKLSSMIVGRSLYASSEAGTATGALTMSSSPTNQLDISGSGSVVQVGVSSGNQTTGTLTIGNFGNNSAITSTNNSTAILVGNRTTTTGDSVTGTLNLSGGSVTIATTGMAIAGGVYATSTLNLSGGVTLKAGASSTNWIDNFDTAEIKAGGAVIHTNGFNLGISQSFIGVGGLTKTGLGTLVLPTVQSYTGPTLVTGGTLSIDAANTATTGNLTVSSNARLGGNGTTPAAVIVQNGGKLLAEITDWNGEPGTGFTDLQVGSLVIEDNWVIDISSPNAYMNFNDVVKSFPVLTATGGITGFAPSKVTVATYGDFYGSGTWSVEQNNNTLSVVYTPSTTSVGDYDVWKETYPDADLSDLNADYDGDGMNNFQEYAFGLDPTNANSSSPVSDYSNLKVSGIFTYTRRFDSGLDYTVWKSTNLQDWSLANIQETTGNIDSNGVETVFVEVHDVMPEAGFFLRVQAVRSAN